MIRTAHPTTYRQHYRNRLHALERLLRDERARLNADGIWCITLAVWALRRECGV